MERMKRFMAAVARIVALTLLLVAVAGCTMGDLPMREGIADLAASYEWQIKQELLGANAGNFFGASVAMSGGYAIVGAPGADSAEGAAYIYSRSGDSWAPAQTIKSTTHEAAEQFGRHVAISDGVAAVTSSATGEVEIFERSGSAWSRSAIVDNGGSLKFGSALDVCDDFIIIGDYSAAGDDGLARIYHKDVTWTPFGIAAPVTSGGERFGFSASISGNYAAVGADMHDSGNQDSGIVYIFQKSDTNTWTQVQSITAVNQPASARFGCSLELRGNSLVIGERGTSKVHFYGLVGSQWTFMGSCSMEGVVVGDEFGTAVALADGIAATGASGKDSNAGTVYPFVLEDGSWLNDTVPLNYSGRQTGDLFGQSVAMFGEYLLIGAYADTNANGTNAGAAYFFQRVQTSGEGAQ